MSVNKNSTPKIRTVAPKSPSTSTVTRRMRKDIAKWQKKADSKEGRTMKGSN